MKYENNTRYNISTVYYTYYRILNYTGTIQRNIVLYRMGWKRLPFCCETKKYIVYKNTKHSILLLAVF